MMKSFLHSMSLLQRNGASHSWWETAKFAARGCVHPRAHGVWGRFLSEDTQRSAWARAHPHLLWKLQRPYIEIDVPTRTKLVWLCDHHLWMHQRWPASVTDALCRRGEALLAQLQLGGQADRQTSSEADAHAVYRLELRIDPQFAKEGELVLSLSRDGERLAVLAFTIHRAGLRWVAHIGCLQGALGEGGAELIRTATKELQGLRPKQAVLQALYALTAAQGVHEIQAVSNRSHVYQAKRRRRERVQADYDAFWTEFGALPLGNSFRLPGSLPRKTLDEIPSRKRAQYRRRHELEDSLAAQLRAVMGVAPAGVAGVDLLPALLGLAPAASPSTWIESLAVVPPAVA